MLGLGFPMRQFFAICDVLVQNVVWATPDMKVVKFALFQLSFHEDVSRAKASVNAWHVVEKMHSVSHSHGPKRGVRHIRPMNGST